MRDQPGAKGQLRVSRYGVLRRASAPLRHVTDFVNGADYDGMEDNDLRGFVDGGFQWGWNQPGQVHVRLGRVGAKRLRSRRFGEQELFRVLQRWDGIALPEHSQVISARLELAVEEGSAHALRVMLYSVKKEWDPGSGGIHENNVSVPKEGEVWWNDVAYGLSAWGLPGAGFASQQHPEADTDAMPLADAVYTPGDEVLELSSPGLARYISERIAAREPLLFLLKLSDYQEDIPGTVLALYSGNHGDSRNTCRRPRLVLDWHSDAEESALARDIALEYGRSLSLPPIKNEGVSWFAFTFLAEPGYPEPTLEVRELEGGDVGAWQRVHDPLPLSGERIEVRVSAVQDPIALGESFAAKIKDTWVVTGPPADRSVVWEFVSPTGVEHSAKARYEGDFVWTVEFLPDELGPWDYSWTHDFDFRPYKSCRGRFDVVAGSAENAREHLCRLAESVERQSLSPADASRARSLWIRFARLQRAAIQFETPETYRSESGLELRRMINRVRSLLWGKPVPDPIPLESHPMTSEDAAGSSVSEPIPLTKELVEARNGQTGGRSMLMKQAKRLKRAGSKIRKVVSR